MATLIDEARKAGPAGAGRHHLDREERDDQRACSSKKRVPHAVLNARFHEQEADDRRPGRRAGRGDHRHQHGRPRHRHQTRRQPRDAAARRSWPASTIRALHAAREAEIRDEIAAAHEKVKQAGGLFVIGTERHESRRIDNQLRGRSGRQGDPGRSRFFLSLEDDLMRIFGSDRMGGMLQRLGLKEGEAIVHPWINKALEKAQKKVEARNFDTRKNVLKYDDVMNDQRKEVYAQRKEFMKADGRVRDGRRDARRDHRRDGGAPHPREGVRRAVGTEGAGRRRAARCSTSTCRSRSGAARRASTRRHLRERIEQAADAMMAAKAANIGPELMRFIEKSLLIQMLDAVWKEHLYALDHLRQGIGLRAYGQRDPLNEYKSEAFALFNAMLDELKERVTAMLARVELAARAPARAAVPAAAADDVREPPRARADDGRRRRPRHGARHGAGSGSRAGLRAADAQRGGGPERPGHMAQHPAQRALPVRVGGSVYAGVRSSRSRPRVPSSRATRTSRRSATICHGRIT